MTEINYDQTLNDSNQVMVISLRFQLSRFGQFSLVHFPTDVQYTKFESIRFD